jgi:hypothetical protein
MPNRDLAREGMLPVFQAQPGFKSYGLAETPEGRARSGLREFTSATSSSTRTPKLTGLAAAELGFCWRPDREPS